jgi:fermentation-respiration switch protein FrsA (DUF1100 family)
MLMSVLKPTLLALGGAYICLALFALLMANRMIFPAPPSSYSADAPWLEQVPFGPGGAAISLRYMEHPESNLLVFYQHGNGEDIGSIEDRLSALHRLGFSVLAWDYPGYGTSEGRPSEKAVMATAERLWRWLPQRTGFGPEATVLYGRSLGGGPAVQLAQAHPNAGLILEGTFTSTFRVMTRIRLLPWDVFDNLSRIPAINSPLLVLHGNRDYVVPFSHSETLFAAASQPKSFVWFDGGGHNDLIDQFPEVYNSAIRQFAAALYVPQTDAL